MIIMAFFLPFFFAWAERILDDNPASFQLEGTLTWKWTDFPTSKDYKLVKFKQTKGGGETV